MINAAQLYDTGFWKHPEHVHALFAEMRSKDPIHFCSHPDYPDFWHITSQEHILEVERRKDDFLNEPRTIINTCARESAVRQMTGGKSNLIRSLVTMDGPEHQKMRLLTQAWFMPKNLQRLEQSITNSADSALAVLRDKGGACDFAKEIAMEYPLRVIMSVLGVPESDLPTMLRLTQELFGPNDPDTKRQNADTVADPAAALRKTFQEFSEYFSAITKDRQKNPKEDVASTIANAKLDGIPISDEFAIGYYIIIATAGHDTTSYSLTEAVYQLARRPDIFAQLKAEPEVWAPAIVEEAIRMASPVRHFVRTAAIDCNLGARSIKAGQSLILWYPSGSRDEKVFKQPDEFDPLREANKRHTAFGHGAHLCLGMHLARQENTRFLRMLAPEVDTLSLEGEPRYLQANFVSGIKSLPIRAVMGGQ